MASEPDWMYRAAREIQRAADAATREHRIWVPGTDWLVEVMLRHRDAPASVGGEPVRVQTWPRLPTPRERLEAE